MSKETGILTLAAAREDQTAAARVVPAGTGDLLWRCEKALREGSAALAHNRRARKETAEAIAYAEKTLEEFRRLFERLCPAT